jgi:hypothetical protein
MSAEVHSRCDAADSVEGLSGTSTGLTRRYDAEEIGGAVFGLGAAGGFIPLVDAGATKGSNGHVLVVGTSKGGHVHVVGLLCDNINISPNAGLVLMGRKFSGVLVKAWEAWNGTPNECSATLLNADNRSPQSRPRLFDAILQQLTTVSSEREAGEVRRLVGRWQGRWLWGMVVWMLCCGVSSSPNAGLVLMGCKVSGVPDAMIYQLNKVGVKVLEVLVGWMLEDELAKTQMDAVNIDVINKESTCPWSVEGEVLCVSYSMLGIYFGRRR